MFTIKYNTIIYLQSSLLVSRMILCFYETFKEFFFIIVCLFGEGGQSLAEQSGGALRAIVRSGRDVCYKLK